MTATDWHESTMNPTGWYMTEKFDGIRFYWDGNEFWTRQGKKMKVPDFISNELPKIALDGELW